MLFTADELIKKSRDQRQRGRYEESLISSISATRSDPENADAWWLLALNRLSLNDKVNALPALKQTVELAPHFSLGWVRYGSVLLSLGDNSAQAAFEMALENDPDQEEALRELTEIYYSQNKDSRETNERELSVLSRLDALVGLSSYQLNRIGILHYQNNSFYEAIRYWKNCAKCGESSSSLFNLDLVYKRPEVSQEADAVDMLRLAAKRYPAESQEAQGRVTKALPRLLSLRKKALHINSTLLKNDQWYDFYLNPFQLINTPDEIQLEDFDVKSIQRLKKILFQEIELEDGIVSWLEECHIDKSKAIAVCEELNDEKRNRSDPKKIKQ